MATAVASRVRDPRDYVKADIWDREIQLLIRDHPFDEVMAERLFGAAVSYRGATRSGWGPGFGREP